MKRVSPFCAIIVWGFLVLFSWTQFASHTFAREEVTWNFLSGNIPERFELGGMSGTSEEDGLHLHAQAEEGRMIAQMRLPFAADVVTLTLGKSSKTEAMLLFGKSGSPLMKLLIAIQGSGLQGQPERIDLPMHTIDGWSAAERFGIALPRGADVRIESITFSRWNIREKFLEGWSSFWTLPDMQAYSINFLWGPLIALTPPERLKLFLYKTPVAFSVLMIGYVVIGCTIIFCASLAICKRTRAAVIVLITVLSLLWILLDLRMGIELINYAKSDYDAYLSQDKTNRKFRNYGDFYSVMEKSSEIIGSAPFVFISDDQSLNIAMRYLAYPAIELTANESGSAKYWLIYRYGAPLVHSDGSLMDGEGKLLSKKGEIIEKFGTHTFLYRAQ